MLRIVGIDPGYAIVGWGVIEYNQNRFTTLKFGAITTPAHTDFSERLEMIYNDACTLFQKAKPDALAIEKLFFNTNTTTAIDVAQARGVIILAAKQAAGIFEEMSDNLELVAKILNAMNAEQHGEIMGGH